MRRENQSVGSGMIAVAAGSLLAMVGGCAQGPAGEKAVVAAAPTSRPIAAADPTFAARVHAETFHSQILSNDRKIEIYLPPGYEKNTDQRYPVMYTNGWFGLYVHGDDVVKDPAQVSEVRESPESLALSGVIQPVIIVAVNGPMETPRDRSYQEGRPVEENEQNSGAFLFGRMLVEEIKPYIDSKYRTLPDQQHTGLAGISIGAASTLYVAVAHPNTFGRIGLTSPHIMVSDYLTVRRVLALKGRLPIRVWMDAGTREPVYIRDTDMLQSVLITKGWDPVQIHRMIGEGDGHDGKAWEKRIGPMFTFLFPLNDSNPPLPAPPPPERRGRPAGPTTAASQPAR